MRCGVIAALALTAGVSETQASLRLRCTRRAQLSEASRGTPNDILLLEARLSQQLTETYPEASSGEFFLVSSIDTLLRRRQLSYQQIEEGITEGSNDGGIDAVFTFLNGTLVEDDSVRAPARSMIELEVRARI